MMDTKDRQHILDIVAADLDGREIEYHRGWHDWVAAEIPLAYKNAKKYPHQYRIKRETMTVYVYRRSNGVLYMSSISDLTDKLVTTQDIPIPPQETEEAEEIELVEFSRPVGALVWGAESIETWPKTGRKLTGIIK
jgi:hypothetical protein